MGAKDTKMGQGERAPMWTPNAKKKKKKKKIKLYDDCSIRIGGMHGPLLTFLTSCGDVCGCPECLSYSLKTSLPSRRCSSKGVRTKFFK